MNHYPDLPGRPDGIPLRLLRLKQVTAIVGISRSMVYLLMNKGAFPKPVKLASRAVGWPEDVIAAWVKSRRG